MTSRPSTVVRSRSVEPYHPPARPTPSSTAHFATYAPASMRRIARSGCGMQPRPVPIRPVNSVRPEAPLEHAYTAGRCSEVGEAGHVGGYDGAVLIVAEESLRHLLSRCERA